jgi:hypothetical protein
MMLVDVERGRVDAISLSRELEKMSQSREESEDGLSEDMNYVIGRDGERIEG